MTVDRTRFRRRASTSAVAIAACTAVVLSGCSPRAGSSGSEGFSASSSQECEEGRFAEANIDWKQQSGTTIDLAVQEHPWWATVEPLISCFEELTGITVEPSVLGEDQFVSKLPTQLSAGAATPDVFMVNQYGQAAGAKWLEPLDAYLNDEKLTDAEWYDVDDFFPGAQNFAKTDGEYLAMPITAEAQMMFIRDDLVETAPTTMEELKKAAADATKDGVSGFSSRAVANANESPWPFAGFAFSNGGEYLSDSGQAELDSAANIAALTTYADLIEQNGPEGSSGWGYLQNLQAMQQGTLAMWTDSSTFLGTLKDEETSKFANDVNAYAFPKGESSKSLPNAWFWTVGINSKSEKKDAAWMFLQWATSLPVSEAGAANGASPAREAAWDTAEASASIGEENAQRVKEAIASVDSSFMAAAWKNNDWSQVADPLARAVNSAVTGSDPTEALETAQSAADLVLE